MATCPNSPPGKPWSKSPRTCSAGCRRSPPDRKEGQAGRLHHLLGNETALSQDGRCAGRYAPAGHEPVLAINSQSFGLTMISAISSKGLMRFEFIESAATTETTRAFIQRLVQNREGNKDFLTLENLRAHHAKVVATRGRRMARYRGVLSAALCATKQPERVPQPGLQDALAYRRSLQDAKRYARKNSSLHTVPGQHPGAGKVLFPT